MNKEPYQMPTSSQGADKTNLAKLISSIFLEYYGDDISRQNNLFVSEKSCWNLDIRFSSSRGDRLRIRNLMKNDVELLIGFRNSLGARSRELFCPYPWDDPKKLRGAVISAVEKSVANIDASYVIVNDKGELMGHFFLWRAGGNEHSLRYGLDIPELGVAVADAHRGMKLGLLAVRILQEVARDLGRDAIELTTEPSNHVAWSTYLKTGFIDTGDINNPLEVDATLVASGQVSAEKFRKEKQMIYIINL